MENTPKKPNRWRDHLQVLAQLAAIGSFVTAVFIASMAATNHNRASAPSAPASQLSR